MTKDVLNRILKQNEMCLAPSNDGTEGYAFHVVYDGDKQHKVVDRFNGVDFLFPHDYIGFDENTLMALVDYAKTSIDERKVQLYNIVVGRNLGDYSFYSAWEHADGLRKARVDNAAEITDLIDESKFQFTKQEIKELTSMISLFMQSVINVGTFPVGTDYEKIFALQ